MRSAVKALLKESHLLGPARELRDACVKLRYELTRKDAEVVERYMLRQGQKKLHIGCGENIIEGWLNADLVATSSQVAQLDATKTYPFADGTFDYIFSEHMIEHITYEEGQSLLKECFRVLKEGGKIRLSTPDLAFLIDLYHEDKSELQQRYIDWSARTFTPDAPRRSDTFVINNFVRAWEHTFIYDEKTLRGALQSAGFANIVRRELNESEDLAFRNLENEGRMPEGFLRLESFTLEATKRRAFVVR